MEYRCNSALQSKNAVCALIKHCRYFHWKYKFTSMHSHAKKLYLHIFETVDTTFGYERELIVCSFLQDFSKGKGSKLELIGNAHTAFLLCGAEPLRNMWCNTSKGGTLQQLHVYFFITITMVNVSHVPLWFIDQFLIKSSKRLGFA